MGTLIGKKGLMQLALIAMFLSAVSFYLGHGNGLGPDEPPASELSSSLPEASDVKQGVDPGPLRTVAAEDEDQEVRVADANATAAQQIVADIARKERHPFDQYDAIVKLADPDALRMVIEKNRNRGNNLDELAVLKLSLLDPNIRAILPDAELVVDANEITQEYEAPPDSFLRTVYHKGEILTLRLFSGEDEILFETYRTEFPGKTSVRIHAFHSASMDIVGFLSGLLGRAEFNDSVSVRLAMGAEHAELRQAALRRLTDQQVLANVALEDEDQDVRKAAVAKMTDLAVLAKIAAEDDSFNVRWEADSRIMLLGKQ